jgi:type I restriction enzyme S subunit
MKSNYKKIGDHIREVHVRNSEHKTNTLLGINIDKYYMPSVANIVGTDLTTYKIVKHCQFACNRMHVGRDYRLPVALSKSKEDFIVSPAYDVFEIIDKEVLMPEYLMMWFSRKEFDRNAWFYTDADVRGGLSWKSFCEMTLPIPHPGKQKEIIAEYNTIINRIKLNNQLIQKLEETAQTIYKQWLVDFEFPDENGNPYKTNGGEMEFNEELQKEIPNGWTLEFYENVMDFKTGKLNSEAAVSDGKYPFFTCSNETFKTNTFSFDTEAVILAGNNASAIYSLKYFVGKFDVYQRTYVVTTKSDLLSNKQIYFTLKSELGNFKGISSGTATKFLTLDILNNLKIIIPDKQTHDKFEFIMNGIFKNLQILKKEYECLSALCETLFSKLATIEN